MPQFDRWKCCTSQAMFPKFQTYLSRSGAVPSFVIVSFRILVNSARSSSYCKATITVNNMTTLRNLTAQKWTYSWSAVSLFSWLVFRGFSYRPDSITLKIVKLWTDAGVKLSETYTELICGPPMSDSFAGTFVSSTRARLHNYIPEVCYICLSKARYLRIRTWQLSACRSA